MTSRKTNVKTASNTLASAPSSSSASGNKEQYNIIILYFPFARYTSVLGVHTSLLTFTALFLPRTSLTSLVDFLANRQAKPQPHSLRGNEVLKTLTENPPRTIVWICAGAFILQLWWAIWMRNWYFEASVLKKMAKNADHTAARVLRGVWNAQRVTVGSFYHRHVSLPAKSPGF